MSKKIKWPTKVRIMSQNWPITYCDIHEELSIMGAQIEDVTHVLGFCDVANRRICIEKTLADGAKAEVLVHEIAHAFFGVLPHDLADEHDEQFAKLFASAFLDFYINNDTDWVDTD